MKRSLFVLAVFSSLALGTPVETEAPAIPVPGNCTVTVWSGMSVSGGRCYYGDVMTGIQSTNPLVIRCSRISVNCSKEAKEEKED